MISRRQIISRSAGPIFTIFSLNESILGVDYWPGHLFLISQGKLPWQPILCKNGAKLPTPLHLSLCHSETEWAIVLRMSALNATLIALHRVKKWWKFVFVILHLAVLIQYQSVTDTETHRQTDRQTHDDGIYHAYHSYRAVKTVQDRRIVSIKVE